MKVITIKSTLCYLLTILSFWGAVAIVLDMHIKAEIFDPNISINSVITYVDEANPSLSSRGNAIMPVEDNKLLVVGEKDTGATFINNTTGTQEETKHTALTLWKYTEQGLLDNEFGNNGTISINQGKGTFVKLTSDGKYLVSGSSYTVSSQKINQKALLAKYNTNGGRELSFGTNGYVYFDSLLPIYEIQAIELLQDNSIVVLGSINGNLNSYLIKINANGTFDQSFGNGGLVEVTGKYFGLSIKPDNKILLSGAEIPTGNSYYNYSIKQYLPAGVLDSTFGSNGTYIENSLRSSGDYFSNIAQEIVITTDNKIYVAGTVISSDSSKHIFIARHNENGALDFTFNIGLGFNIFEKDISSTYRADITDLKILGNGDLVISGSRNVDNTDDKLLLVEFTKNGDLDLDFNKFGYYSYPEASQINKILLNNSHDFYAIGYQVVNNICLMNLWRIKNFPLTPANSTLSFGSLIYDSSGYTKEFEITNTTDNTIRINGMYFSSAGKFSVSVSSTNCINQELAAKSSCKVGVFFQPTTDGYYYDYLKIKITDYPDQLIFVDATVAVKLSVFRFFNKLNGAHLYTVSTSERDSVLGLTDTWNYEGEKFKVLSTRLEGTLPVYRFFNTKNGAHLYTISEDEKNTIESTLPYFQYEGIKFYVYEDQHEGIVPMYRFFNSQNGAHLYTISEDERNTVINSLPYFKYEGIKFYVE